MTASLTPTRVGDGWEFTHPEGPLLTVDQLAPSKGVLYAWVELRWDNGSGVKLLSAATRNLMGPTTASSLAGDAAVSSPMDKGWWQPLLVEALHFVVTQHREGRPTVDLHEVADSSFHWIVRPIVESGGHSRLIAAGGAGKSFLVLAIAVSLATGVASPFGTVPTETGPVVYLDWETQDGGRTHGNRLRAVAAGMDVTLEPGMVLHQQHDLPLIERASSVARLVDKVDARLVIVDSNTMARGSGGRAGFEAATTDLLQALRIIGRPALIIDHKSKDQLDKGKTGGYGSIHNENQVRMQWEWTRVFPQGGDVVRVLLENTKQNNVAQQAPIGLEVEFHNDATDPDRPRLEAVTFQPITKELVRAAHFPGVVDDGGASSAEKAFRWLSERGEPATLRQIGDALGFDRTSLQKALKADRRFYQAGTIGRAAAWYLTADAEPTLPVSEATGEPTPDPW